MIDFVAGAWSDAYTSHDMHIGPCKCGAWHNSNDMYNAGGSMDRGSSDVDIILRLIRDLYKEIEDLKKET